MPRSKDTGAQGGRSVGNYSFSLLLSLIIVVISKFKNLAVHFGELWCMLISYSLLTFMQTNHISVYRTKTEGSMEMSGVFIIYMPWTIALFTVKCTCKGKLIFFGNMMFTVICHWNCKEQWMMDNSSRTILGI